MTTTFLNAATNDTFGFESWTSTSGTVASDSSIFHTPPRSIKLTGTGSVTKASILADAGRRIDFFFNASAAPTTDSNLVQIQTSGGGEVFSFVWASSGFLVMRSGGAAISNNQFTVPSRGVFHRCALSYTVTSTTVYSIKVWIDGTLMLTSTATNPLANTGSAQLLIQGLTVTGGTNTTNISDVYVDDSSAVTDPGNIIVTAKLPFSNGTTNGFTTQIGSGGSGYGTGHAQQVNERPLNTANGWSMVGAGSAVTEEYSIETAAQGDVVVSGTIIDFGGWVYASSLANETAQIIVAGATTNISLTTSNTYFIAYAGSSTYPGGGTDVGIVTSTALTTVSLFEAGVLVAFIPFPAYFDDASVVRSRMRQW